MYKRWENIAPEVVMEQSIREVDKVINNVRAILGNTIVAKHINTKKLSEKNNYYEELSLQIEHAIREVRDDLAEAAVSKQIDVEAQVPVLENAITACCEREKELEGYISALSAKKRELKDELVAFRQSQSEISTNGDVSSVTSASIEASMDEATSAFERIRRAKKLCCNKNALELSRALFFMSVAGIYWLGSNWITV